MVKRALFIASAKYADESLPSLSSPASDARRLAEILRRPGLGDFEVSVLVDPALVEAQESIYRIFGQAGPDDLILIHLSGHGLRDSVGRFHFALRETKSSALVATSLSGRFIREQMADSASRNIVIILDCCFAGAFGRDLIAKSYTPLVGVPEDFTGECRAVLTASSAVQLALEEELETGATSVFTRAIADGLATGAADLNNDGIITVGELFEYSSREVRNRYVDQTPQLSLLGTSDDLPIANAPASRRNVIGVDEDVTSALYSHHLQLRLAAVDVLQLLLHSRDPDRAASAKKKLREARDDVHPQVRAAVGHVLASAPKARRRTLPLQGIDGSMQQYDAWVEVDGRTLANAALSVSAAAGDDPTLPLMTCVKITSTDRELIMVATNRYRLAHYSLPAESGAKHFELLVRASDLVSVKAFSSKKRVQLHSSDTTVEVIAGDKFLALDVERLPDYPPVENFVRAKPSGAEIQFSRSVLIDAVERVLNSLTGQLVPVAVKWTGSSSGELVVFAVGNVDSIKAAVSATGVGTALTVGFNPAYLLSAVASFNSRTVTLLAESSAKPVFFMTPEEPGHIQLVMPVRTVGSAGSP